MSKARDLTGQRFGRLRALRRVGTQRRYALWECVCDCDATTSVTSGSLLSGRTRSCGCLRVDLLMQHKCYERLTSEEKSVANKTNRRRYYARHRAKILAGRKTKEKLAEQRRRSKAYADRHPDRVAFKAKRWRKENRNTLRNYARAYAASLQDGFVRQVIRQLIGIPVVHIPQELIEAKRAQLRVFRLLKETKA